MRRWGHVRTFTPVGHERLRPRPRARSARPRPSGDALPTGDELAAGLLEPLAALPALRGRLRLGHARAAIGREGLLKHEAIGAAERAQRPFRLLRRRPRRRGGDRARRRRDRLLRAPTATPTASATAASRPPARRAFEDRIERYLPAFDGRASAGPGAPCCSPAPGTPRRPPRASSPRSRATRPARGWSGRCAATSPTGAPWSDDPLPERAALNATAAELAAGASPAVSLRAGVVTEALAAERRPDRGDAAQRRHREGRGRPRPRAQRRAWATPRSTASCRCTSATRRAGR